MDWSSRKGQELRKAHLQYSAEHNLPCGICGKRIKYTAPPGHRWGYECDHIIARSIRPDLTFEWDNLQPSHKACNRSKRAKPPAMRDIHLTKSSNGWPGG